MQEGKGRERGPTHQPASRERAAERMHGVSTQVLGVGTVFEPIALVVGVI